MKRKLVVGWGVIVVATIAVTLVLAQFYGAPWTLPSDASLERDFRSHRVQFDSLVTLALSIPGLELAHPGIAQVGGRVIHRAASGTGMTPERWNELQRLMFELKIAGVWPAAGSVVLDRAVHTTVIKGYRWTSAQPTDPTRSATRTHASPAQTLVPKLDGASPGAYGELHRAIGDGWYLILRRND